MSESRFDVVSENTWKSSHPAQSSTVSLSRANSDLSLYAPVRRRSVVEAPGVATRTAVPPPQLAKKTSFRHSHTGTPSHSRHNSMESDSYRVLSMPPRLVDPDTVERVVTPVESHYKQLGGMKFGSLRITNGDASPFPSPETERPRRKPVADAAITITTTEEVVAISSDNRRTEVEVVVKKSDSLLIQSPELKEPKPIYRLLSPITTTFLKLDANSTKSSAAPKSPAKGHSPKPALEGTTGEYLEQIHFSPFSMVDSREGTPELKTTSKHTAQEDNLFEDDVNIEISSVEILDIRDDWHAKPRLERPRPDPTQKSVRSVTRTDSGFVSSPTSESSHKPLSKADSGYSSNVSLRSFQSSKPARAKKEAPGPVSPRERSESRGSFLSDFRVPSPTLITMDDIMILEPPSREAPPPPIPPKDQPPLLSPNRSTHTPSPPLAAQHVALLAVPAKKAKKTPAAIDSSKSARAPLPSPEAQLSPAGSDSSNSTLSIGSGSHRPGKLLRLLSGASMRGPPSVHVTHPTDKSVPSVPVAIEARLHEHTGLFPMTTKRLALRKEASKETLKTIFSVGSVEVTHTEQSFQAVQDYEENRGSVDETKLHRKRSLQSLTGSLRHVAAHVMPSRKPVPHKAANPAQGGSDNKKREKQSTAKKQQLEDQDMDTDYEVGVTSLDSIRNSIGNSAFDQALFAAMAEERDAYFSPAGGRASTMTAQLERDMELRLARSKGKSPELQLQDAPSPIQSPLLPDMLVATTANQPGTVRTRSVRNLRVPPPLRPQSDGGPGRTQSLSRKPSRESVRSYPQAMPAGRDGTPSPPPLPAMNPRRSLTSQDLQQAYPAQHSAPGYLSHPEQSGWRPGKPPSSHSRGSSTSSSSQNVVLSPPYDRPASASPYDQQRRRTQPQLRHRSSHDSFNQPYALPGPSPYMTDPWMAAQYRQRQQRELQQAMNKYSGGGSDQANRHPPPYVLRSNHHRNRSLNNGPQPHNPPYRILHSYNSPAYKNVPIWG